MLTTWAAASALDRMLDDVMGSSLGAATNQRAFDSEFDVRTNENEVRLVCDVPGVRREDLEITLEGATLTISGVRKFEARKDEQVMLGRRYGAFKRVFTLPDGLDDEKLAANLSDGVLTVSLPRHPKAKPIKIQIGRGSPDQLGEGATPAKP